MSSRTSSNVPVADLTEAQAKAELKRLAAEIGEHDKRYYQDDAPTVSDADYDALRRRNEEIEARSRRWCATDSPSRRVGAQPSQKFAKVRHAVPMLSLGNAFSDDEVIEFVERVRRFLRLPAEEKVVFTAEPKIDGLSCTLRYEGGRWCGGATRGDGTEGEDVTANVRTLADIPDELARQTRARRLRGARRGLHDQVRFPGAERTAEGGRQAALRQSAQLGGGLAAPARSGDHRVPPVRFFAYGWGGMSESRRRRNRACSSGCRLRVQDQSADACATPSKG